jgi:hypothetical protein
MVWLDLEVSVFECVEIVARDVSRHWHVDSMKSNMWQDRSASYFLMQKTSCCALMRLCLVTLAAASLSEVRLMSFRVKGYVMEEDDGKQGKK